MERKNLKLFFGLIFIFASIVILYVFNSDKNRKIDNYINQKRDQAITNYHSVYNEYFTISHAIYDSQINNPNIINIFKNAHISNETQKNTVRKKL